MLISFGTAGYERRTRFVYNYSGLNIMPEVFSMKDNFLIYATNPTPDNYELRAYDAVLKTWWIENLSPAIDWPALSHYGTGGSIYKFASAGNDSMLIVFYADPRNAGRGMDITGKGYKIVNNRLAIPPEISDLTKDNLLGIYPNPAKEKARVSFFISHPYYVSITLYDILGRELMPVFSGYCERGYYEEELDTRNLPSGAYILRMNSLNGGVKKISIIK